MTEFIPTFLMSILGVTGGLVHNPGRMRLIMRRPYAYLETRIRQAFEGRDDVEVITDRRRGDRRLAHRPVQEERRQDARRKPKEEILEVVIDGDPFTMFRTTSQR